MLLSVDTLRRYCGLKPSRLSDPDDPGSPLVGGEGDAVMLDLSLRSAEEACARFTGRHLSPLPGHVVSRRGEGRVFKVPDARSAVASVAGEPVDVELIAWPAEDSPAPWVRLPVDPAGALVQVTGDMGFETLPADLEDSIYVFAARRYRERDAGYSDSVDLGDGTAAAYFRSMPANVRQTWEIYQLPAMPVVSVQVTTR